jgi:hypothetical protein
MTYSLRNTAGTEHELILKNDFDKAIHLIVKVSLMKMVWQQMTEM